MLLTQTQTLIHYMARPSVSDERIELLPDDNVRIKLKTASRDSRSVLRGAEGEIPSVYSPEQLRVKFPRLTHPPWIS